MAELSKTMKRALRVLNRETYACFDFLVKFPVGDIKVKTLAALRKRGLVDVLDYSFGGNDFPARDNLSDGTAYFVRVLEGGKDEG